MLNWFKSRKKRAQSQPERDERWGDYNGEGIWWICPDCENPHEVTDEAFLREVQSTCSVISESSHRAYREFDLISSDGRWDIDPDTGIFTTTTGSGRRAHGQYGLVGSWNQKTHSWLWSWEMGDDWMPPQAVRPALALRDKGQAAGWEITSAQNLLLNEEETWHITNLAADAAGFPTTYRAMVNDINHHYFIIDELKWEVLQ